MAKQVKEVYDGKGRLRQPFTDLFVVETRDHVRYVFLIVNRHHKHRETEVHFSHRYFPDENRRSSNNHPLPQCVEDHVTSKFGSINYSSECLIE